jgi:hypothetical protein
MLSHFHPTVPATAATLLFCPFCVVSCQVNQIGIINHFAEVNLQQRGTMESGRQTRALRFLRANNINRCALIAPLHSDQPPLHSGRVKFSIPAWQLAKEWCADSEDRYRIHAKA